MTTRERLSATIDADLLAAGRCSGGGAGRELERMGHRGLRRQADHGDITEQGIEAATRRARARAVVVRTPVREKDWAPESHTTEAG
jgi:hypothetical protein